MSWLASLKLSSMLVTAALEQGQASFSYDVTTGFLVTAQAWASARRFLPVMGNTASVYKTIVFREVFNRAENVHNLQRTS
jgi:hypothetical protein